MNLANALAAAADRLASSGIPEPRREASSLIANAIDRDRVFLIAHPEYVLTEREAAAVDEFITRRSAREPFQYIVGRQEFYALDFLVNSSVLIPRPETELLVDLALARIAVDAVARVADLGTGSGAIALAIAKERARASLIATDASNAALEVARRNATRNRIATVEFREGDWLAPLAGDTFDLIASNPPYIADGDPHLGEGDLRFEPPTALSSGAEGLDAIRRIVGDAPAHLEAGGWLLLEHGWDQGEAVRALLQAAGFIDVETVQDLEGRDRVTLGRTAD